MEFGIKRKQFGHLKCYGFIGAEPFFCIGPDWPFFLCLYLIILGVALFFLIFICPTIGKINTVIGAVLYSFLLISYLLAATLNPGIEMNTLSTELQPGEIDNFCSICEVYRSPRAEHCDDCGVCIKEYDHHCPWTSKCIGKGNIRFFYCFLFGIVSCFIFSLGTLGIKGQSILTTTNS